MPTSKAAAPFDSALVRDLAGILNDTGLSEIEVEHEGFRIRVAKSLAPTAAVHAAPQPVTPAPAAVSATPVGAPAPVARTGEVVNSPMVGTVYLQAQPGAPPFAKTGDMVTAGQTLLLIEAMKTMNPISAPKAGRLLEILVADAQPVEYGEPLAVIG
jgi:acetyl-CoA carboxylase biotin carboxyl carrier protein